MYPTSIVALFCEDIREEKSGATTVLGVLPDNANVPPMPANLPARAVGMMPKLCIYLRLHFDPKEGIGPVAVKFTFPDGTSQSPDVMDSPTIEQARSEALAKGSPIAGVVSRVEMIPFPVPTLGRLSVEAVIGKQAYMCGSLNFIREDEPAKA